MLVTNYSIPQTEGLLDFPGYSNNFGALQQVYTGDIIADARMLSRISSTYFEIKQFRVYCKKIRIQRTIHFKSMLNQYGFMFRDAMFDSNKEWLNSITQPDCNHFFHIYPNNDSRLMSDCSKWDEPKHDTKITNSTTLYQHLIFTFGSINPHLQLTTSRIECDDHELNINNNNAGLWQYYVR